MSQWVGRRNVQLAAIIAWVIAVIAVVLLVNSAAPLNVVLWTGLCLGLACQMLRRRR